MLKYRPKIKPREITPFTQCMRLCEEKASYNACGKEFYLATRIV